MQIIASQTGEFTTSLFKALDDIDPKWPFYNGLILSGSHDPTHVALDKSLNFIRQARESKLPTLGICFGLEMAIVEYARNVWGWPTANSEELDPNALVKVIEKMPGFRVGVRPVLDRLESHWHQYKISEGLTDALAKDFQLIITEDVIEQLTLKGHPFYVLTQYHPEYSSTPWDPHPVLKQFIEACKKIS